MSFSLPHNLNAGDTITLTGFAPAGLNATYTIQSTPSLTDVTFATASSSATAIGAAVLSNGANVGAHLICQEAMS